MRMVSVQVINLFERAQVVRVSVMLMLVTVVIVSGIGRVLFIVLMMLLGLLSLLLVQLLLFLFLLLVQLLSSLVLLFVHGLVALTIKLLITVVAEVFPFLTVHELFFNVGLLVLNVVDSCLLVFLLGSLVLILRHTVVRVVTGNVLRVVAITGPFELLVRTANS